MSKGEAASLYRTVHTMRRFKVRYRLITTQWKVRKENAKDKKRIKSKFVQFTSGETERLKTRQTRFRGFLVSLRGIIF